jgi:hypothetical protein
MIQNLFARSASAGTELIRAFGARLVLAMGYGLRQVPASERKTILEKGLRELWFLAMLVVQWWAERLPKAEGKVIDERLEPYSLKPLATNLKQIAEKLEPFVRATYEASSDANLAGAGVYFKTLLEDVGADTLTKALRFLPLDAAQEQLFKGIAPPDGLDAEFKHVLASTPAPPVVKPEARGDRFERADLGTRKTPPIAVVPPAADLAAQEKLRSYFASLGWAGADLDRILGGPSGVGGARS